MLIVFLLFYFVFSSVAFALYGYDKFAARTAKWRVPEKSLHTVAIVGGWPGALIAQRVLRHKTIKQPFQSILWVTVVLNCLAVFLLGAGSLYLHLN